MSNFTYTKKVIFTFVSLEAFLAHHQIYSSIENHMDWFYNELENGRADSTLPWLPWRFVAPSSAEVLCLDQAQAESLIANETLVAQQTGFASTSEIIDFTDDIKSFSFEWEILQHDWESIGQ